ncbi:unnamed protein product [Fusarium graminearum]|uniref:Uncharacterized protein n=1 Tax=Gibberella zeae TaxID=5518 RepID=A0A4E9EJ01_GIBZA|nr:unnamed protein product [Fusarium graminearum]
MEQVKDVKSLSNEERIRDFSQHYNQTLEDMKRSLTWVNRDRVCIKDWVKKERYLRQCPKYRKR